MAIEIVVRTPSPSFVGQVVISILREHLEQFPVAEFFEIPGGNSSPPQEISVYGTWPEEPVRFPSFVVEAILERTTLHGFGQITDEGDETWHQNLSLSYTEGSLHIGVLTPTYEHHLRMQSLLQTLLFNPFTLVSLEENGITLTSHQVVFSRITTVNYGTIRRFTSGLDVPFRYEGVVGKQYTGSDTVPVIESEVSEANPQSNS